MTKTRKFILGIRLYILTWVFLALVIISIANGQTILAWFWAGIALVTLAITIWLCKDIKHLGGDDEN